MGGINFIRDVHLSRQKDKAQAAADEAYTKERIAQMNALGTAELGEYEGGALTPEEQSVIRGYRQSTGADVSAFEKKAAGAGGASSSFEKSLSDNFIIDSTIMKESMRETHWAKAIQALGYSWQETQMLIQESTAERQQKIETYQSLMGAIGGVVGLLIKAYSGGGGGGK